MRLQPKVLFQFSVHIVYILQKERQINLCELEFATTHEAFQVEWIYISEYLTTPPPSPHTHQKH